MTDKSLKVIDISLKLIDKSPIVIDKMKKMIDKRGPSPRFPAPSIPILRPSAHFHPIAYPSKGTKCRFHSMLYMIE
ncbi:hypothetical protein E2R51_08480 [Jeotgalibacillus sp. S-D1]|uniref:hypothetical protein n=1 Tax=Jeotgalibacillus sp. S-D1 TaxID=2552189 RepID=UPI0010599EAA|nr:hypothetical protein [Jeotgalibacillus sp. S-D1]TDL32704.1 hypothetical protein E2R51_08480 [Jeotgalibacillus sp. S-D1]